MRLVSRASLDIGTARRGGPPDGDATRYGERSATDLRGECRIIGLVRNLHPFGHAIAEHDERLLTT